MDDEHDEDNDIITRQWIKNQISQLSPKDLRDLLDFLNDNLGASIYRKLHLVFERKISAAEESASSTSSATQLSISRRKMHWVVLRINAQLQRELRQDGGSCDDAISVILPSVALVPLWTNGLVDILRKHPDWKVKICKLIMQEAGREIVAEFSSSNFGDFVSTRKIWCPMAERLFRITVDLLAGFTAELGPSTSEERLVNDICSLVSKAAQKVKSLVADPHNQEPCAYTDLVLTFQKGVTHNSNALPSAEEVRLSSPNQAYFEAMSLCDEPAWKPRAPDDLRVVATRNQETSDSNTMEDTNKQTEPLMQSVEEMKQGNHVIDLRWYIERQILPVVETVALSGVAHLAQHQDYKNLTDIQARIREAARAVIGDPNIQGYDLKARNETTPTCVQLPRVLRDQSGCVKMYQPNSLQLFLGLVWPKLRLSGWKLEAGELPSDVIFCPPRRNLSRVRLMKQEAARQRSKLSKKTNDLGLGYVAKSTKRLLINSAAIGEKMDVRENTVSVSDALGRFFLFQEKLVEDAESLRRLREIVNHVAHCFEELAPKLLYIEEKEKHKAGEGQKFIETLGCEYLMRLLVVMPSMLQQSDLSFQQVKDTVGVIRELTHFLVANHESLFDESLCLPHEEYREELGFTPYLVSRLKEVKSHDVASSSANRSADEDMDELRDVVLPKDRPDLTDFVDCVMSQVTVCRATDEDTGRKGRRVQIGHPGLVCKHCLGRGGEGKYFFGSIESFTTASTTIEKHIAKCPSIDSELKNKMVRFRARHAEQRKNMPQGVQGAFFARLWERLRRSSRSSMGGEADMFVTFSASSDQPGGSVDDEGTEAAASRSSDNQVEFKSHLQILHFLQSTSPWKDNKGELRDAFEQYYNCLEYGGQIYNTNAMPPHFNSEWLLSKIAPRGGASHR